MPARSACSATPCPRHRRSRSATSVSCPMRCGCSVTRPSAGTCSSSPLSTRAGTSSTRRRWSSVSICAPNRTSAASRAVSTSRRYCCWRSPAARACWFSMSPLRASIRWRATKCSASSWTCCGTRIARSCSPRITPWMSSAFPTGSPSSTAAAWSTAATRKISSNAGGGSSCRFLREQRCPTCRISSAASATGSS